jgi:isoquinoline 1-oxidoreductase subunit beta
VRLAGGTAAALVLEFQLARGASPALAAAAGSSSGAGPFAAWLRIAADDVITVLLGQAEMGQGVYTGLPLLIAEELEADWRLIRVELAPSGPAYVDPGIRDSQITVGSRSTVDWNVPLQTVGAQAREMLRAAAASRWNVPVSECFAQNGAIRHPGSRRKLTYGALAEAASRLQPPRRVALKRPGDWQLLGRMVKPLDAPLKVDGSAVYGMDVDVPGMLTGTVRATPIFGAKLKAIDKSGALRVRGLHSIVELDHAVLVVADSYWSARQAADALVLQWSDGDGDSLSSEALSERFRAALAGPALLALDTGVRGEASRSIEAVYEAPYLAHACMEPLNATVRVTAHGAEVWKPTQAPSNDQRAVAKILDVSPDRVLVHTTFLGGGFGRRQEVDDVVYAALASKACGGRPVKIIWSREEDMRHDFYRPMAAARLRAEFDGSGAPVSLDITLAAQSVAARTNPAMLKGGVDYAFALTGLEDVKYAFAARRLEYSRQDNAVPVGSLRSLGASFTAYFLECFLDEIAQAADDDPLELRRKLLAAHPRHLAVLDGVADQLEWSRSVPRGHGRGIALYETCGSITAAAVELSVSGVGRLHIHKVAGAIDCGRALNPNGVLAQAEGALIFGLTAALYGEIQIEHGRVIQGNFDSYRMMLLAQVPEVSIRIIESDAAIGGVGEPLVAPAAPALVNALFAATGRRIRSLPLTRHGFSL